MNKRPLSVTVIGILFLAAGIIGLAYHASEFKFQTPFPYDQVWVLLVRFLAIIGAVFLLRGNNWARWLIIIWMAYHVILSAFHSVSGLIVHSLLLAVIACFLFLGPAAAYFRSAKTAPATNHQDPAVK